MSTLIAAERYVRHGFAVVPIPARKKKPVLKGWERLRLGLEDLPEHFNGRPQNVGLLLGGPSGWLVDVDLDSDEAAAVAGRFLPPTLTSGRTNRPHSHWWFKGSGAKSRDWSERKGTELDKLVELRSDGRQTLVAPSLHPNGDQYLWHSESGLEITEVGAAELEEACRELATAALLAPRLPPIRDEAAGKGGGRHDYAMALAGFLLRPGRLDEHLTLKVLKAAWDAKGWPDERSKREAHRDLEGIVRDTNENLEAGEPVVGGPTLEEMAPGVVKLLCKWWRWSRDERELDVPGRGEDKEERRSQADRLVGYALEDLEELFVDQHGAPHALVNGEPVPLTSRCYSWLRRLMWEQEERVVNSEYLKTAAGTLAAHAEFSGKVRKLHTRAAWHEGALYYELRPGRVAKVDGTGCRFESNPPLLFRRFPNLKPLPDPESGGSLGALGGLVNLKTERDRRLFKAYLVTVPLSHVGRPILNASGAMGSGKTTIGRIVKRTWDPTAPETVRLDPRDFLQKATHAYVVMLDNQNTIPEWAADTLCRLVTGEADSKRRLYTDDEDVIIELRRAVLLNGINVPTDRGDVLDRSLVVELKRIPDGERKTEEELWEGFEREHPKLLGAAFGVLAKAVAHKPSLKLSRRPMLADWGEYAAAVYEVMGWGTERFLDDWDEVVRVQNQATLDGSPVAQAVIKFMEGKFMEDKREYAASSSELHKKLSAVAAELGVDRDKAWPKSASWLWKRIKEVLPVLVISGIEAERIEDKQGSQIALRRMPTDAATAATEDKNAAVKGETDGSKDDATATLAATGVSAATGKAHKQAGYGSKGGSGSKSGDSSEESRKSTWEGEY